MRRIRQAIFRGVVFFGFFVGTFIVVEGAASAVLLGYDVLANPNEGLASRVYSTYDSTIGWVNLPGFRNDDLYGPGVGVTINAQSFRHDGEVPRSAPAGRLRVVCSGDSFTFGIGVAGSATWCRGLEQLESVETVNLGHSGYGLDQSSLFHERVRQQLRYDVHVMAFISDDFRRMTLRRFVAYDKPVIRLAGEELVVENIPVPTSNAFTRWFVLNNQSFRLRSLEFAWRLLDRSGRTDSRALSIAEARATAVAIMQRVADRDRSQGSDTVFVLLHQDVRDPISTEEWGEFLALRLAERGLTFVDLSKEFRKLQVGARRAMMDPHWSHYSVQGNDWVAAQLRDQLRRLPALARHRTASGDDRHDSK